MKPILVTGASGFLGDAIVARFRQAGEVVGCCHTNRSQELVACDLRDASDLRRLLDEHRPRAVVHSAAYRDPDVCETDPEEARRLNVAPAAQFASDLPADVPLVFISSDYVFDGMRPPYGETDPVGPVNVYGQTKVEAEAAVLARPGGIVLRVPVLIGAGASLGESGYVGQLIATARAKTPVEQDDVCVRVPTWTADVADAIAFLLAKGERGIFHFSGPRAVTRYQSLVDVAELLGESHDHVTPSTHVIPRLAQRPMNSQLDTTHIQQLGFTRATDLCDVVRHVLATVG